MNRSYSRLIRATIGIGSFVAIIAIGIPWVDEYLGRRRDVNELVELRAELEQATFRDQRLGQIATQLVESLQTMQGRSIKESEAARVRDVLTEVVRKSGAKLRHIDAIPGQKRPWGISDDDVRKTTAPEIGQESNLVLTTVTIELKAAGPIEAINKILSEITSQGWLMSTTALVIAPAEDKSTDVALEIRMTAFGLELESKKPTDELAMQANPSRRITDRR
jgi:hypothetical protein